MNKGEIKALDNTSLIAHAMHIESVCTNEANSNRGISNKTKKDYKWTVEEVVTRFGLDREKLIDMTGAGHWWDK